MDQSKEQIMHMLDNGKITAEEADRLLNAVDESIAASESVVEQVAAVPLPDNLPHVDEFRRNWKTPFVFAVAAMAFTGRHIFRRGKRGFFGKVLLPFHWMMFLAAGAAALLSLWGRDARWVYLNIEEADGRHLTFTFPVPVHLLGWVLRTVKPWVDDPETAAQVSAAAEFIQALHDEMDRPDGDPIVIDVKDDDGDRVQIYFM